MDKQNNNFPRMLPPSEDIQSVFVNGYKPIPVTAGSVADIQTHRHDGVNSQRINLNTDIDGFFETVSTAPTAAPKDFFGQVKIYVNGGTKLLYIYDAASQVWRTATIT